eukprot:3875217-Prymnesium_polylepis.2
MTRRDAAGHSGVGTRGAPPPCTALGSTVDPTRKSDCSTTPTLSGRTGGATVGLVARPLSSARLTDLAAAAALRVRG